MRTNRIVAAIAVATVLWIAGCSNPSDVSAAATEIKPQSATKMGAGDNVDQSGAKIISDPKKVEQGGSYKLQPPNPDDPHFKADPKLSGGG
jgi:hypothetical protein